MKVRAVQLSKLYVAVSKCMSRKDLAQLKNVELVGPYFDRMLGDMYYSLQAFVLGEEPEPMEIKHPVDWWQAVKERFGPQWWLKRSPVRYTRHTISFQVAYPHYKYKLPDEKHTIHVSYSSGEIDESNCD